MQFPRFLPFISPLLVALVVAACAGKSSSAADSSATEAASAYVWQPGQTLTDQQVAAIGIDSLFVGLPITDALFARMWLRSWKADCPLSRDELTYLRLLHRTADGQTLTGEMIVNTRIAQRVLRIFRALYDEAYPIERIALVDEYGADDEAVMTANVTSAFNFRFMTGSTTKISKHGLGLAIDLNPLYNPYVKRLPGDSVYVEPAAGRPYALDRSARNDIPYKIDRSDLAYRLFTAEGFAWGGAWHSCQDYQHFEWAE